MYYIINKDTRQVIRVSPTPFNADESIQPDPPLIQLKGIENNAEPVYNPALQKLQRTFTDDDILFTRTFYFIVVDKTQEEIDAYQAELDAEATRQQLKAVYTALRDGQGTAGERLIRVEKAVAWLLRNSVK